MKGLVLATPLLGAAALLAPSSVVTNPGPGVVTTDAVRVGNQVVGVLETEPTRSRRGQPARRP